MTHLHYLSKRFLVIQRLIIAANTAPDNDSIAPAIMPAETKKTGSSRSDPLTDPHCCVVDWLTGTVVTVEVVDVDISSVMLEVGPLVKPVSFKVTVVGSTGFVALACVMTLVVVAETVLGTELKQSINRIYNHTAVPRHCNELAY